MNRWMLASLGLAAVVVAGTFVLFWGFPNLWSDPLPVHWNAAGEVDQTVPLDEGWFYFLLGPGVMALMVLLTVALPWLSPKQFDIDRFRDTFHYVMFLVVALFAYIQSALILACLKDPPIRLDMGQFIIGGMFLFFALLGNVMGKVQRNFFMGVRTPWTLASDTVWVQTHRLAAWLYTAAGVLGVFIITVAGVIQAMLQQHWTWLFVGLFVAFMIVVLIPVPYSLILYKRLQREGKLESLQSSDTVVP